MLLIWRFFYVLTETSLFPHPFVSCTPAQSLTHSLFKVLELFLTIFSACQTIRSFLPTYTLQIASHGLATTFLSK